jgi:excisionase family DNA binding protein
MAFVVYVVAVADRVLIPTGEAAAIHGCSRQHVVNLCNRGMLPVTYIGTHRRVRRADVERLVAIQPSALRREQRRNRWLHVAVAGRLVEDPDTVTSNARANLDRLLARHQRGGVNTSLLEWRRLLDGSIEGVIDALTSTDSRHVELRQNSPFAGVLSSGERARLLRTFEQPAS